MLSVGFVANFFRFLGDILHISSKIVLANKIEKTKSCSGLSLKTQVLYLTVFVSRYLDLFTPDLKSLLGVYNTILKILFISFQATIIYLIRIRYYSSYDRRSDSFRVIFLIIPCLVIAPFVKYKSYGLFDYISEFGYSFSLMLESVAILPQLVQLQEEGESESLTSAFVLLLGLYRTSYTIYFVIKKLANLNVCTLLIACGVLQIVLYSDFFLIYYKHVFLKLKKDKDLPKRTEREI